jgi:hypothetical protein
VKVMLDVRAGAGRSRMTGLSRAGGRWSGRSGAIRFRWSGAAKARPGADGLALECAARPSAAPSGPGVLGRTQEV